MTARLRNRKETPPCQWRYLEMETGYLFNENDHAALLSAVAKHREYKGLPSDPDTVLELVEAQLCLTLDDSRCHRDPGDTPQIIDKTHAIDGKLVLGFNKALFSFLKDGLQFANREEAQRRADICAACPLNKSLTQCSCSAFYKIIEKMIPAERRDKRISVCASCGCSLQAKVNMEDSVIQASTPDASNFPEWCWQPEVLAKTSKT